MIMARMAGYRIRLTAHSNLYCPFFVGRLAAADDCLLMIGRKMFGCVKWQKPDKQISQ
jgi:hypothetical protein